MICPDCKGKPKQPFCCVGVRSYTRIYGKHIIHVPNHLARMRVTYCQTCGGTGEIPDATSPESEGK